MLDVLDADAVRSWARAAVLQLETHCAEVDALNVYPVPDSDTGSNMLATMRAGVAELDAVSAATASAALAALAIGAARGALGNSGFILSQILRGVAESTLGDLDVDAVRVGLDRGASFGRTAVVDPVEGTVLTVARAAADGAVGSTLAQVVVGAVHAADAALQRTQGQLAELARAGVVDAGGRGLVLVLEALARTVTGAGLELTPVHVPRRGAVSVDPDRPPFEFEVQYVLDLAADPGADPAAGLTTLRASLSDLGDSVAVVRLSDSQWKVHAHVDDAGAAIEAGLAHGRTHQISVTRLRSGDEADDHARPDHRHEHTQPLAARGPSSIVAVAPGTGLAHLFEAEGVHVVEAPDGEPLSARAVETAVRAVGARELVLLPNASDATAMAEAAAASVRADGLRVSVVPTKSPVQGLAAVAVHDPLRRFDDDVVAMAEAAAATRYAELTVARDQALTAVGICEPGDILGLIDGEVVEIGRGLLAVAFSVVDRLLGVGAELITVLVGADAPPRTGELIEAHVRGRAPLTDVAVYDGGQLDNPVIIGVE